MNVWEEIRKVSQSDPGSIYDIHLDHVLSGVSNLFLLGLNVKLIKMTTDKISAATEVNQKLHI